MKFGRSSTGQTYFVNASGTPVLYLAADAYLASSAAQDVRWYPLPARYVSSWQPVYVWLAPTYRAYTTMGYYPGMVVYGGIWPDSADSRYLRTTTYTVNVNGTVIRSYDAYYGYYTNHPGYMVSRAVDYGTPAPTPYPVRRSGGRSGPFVPGIRTVMP